MSDAMKEWLQKRKLLEILHYGSDFSIENQKIINESITRVPLFKLKHIAQRKTGLSDDQIDDVLATFEDDSRGGLAFDRCNDLLKIDDASSGRDGGSESDGSKAIETDRRRGMIFDGYRGEHDFEDVSDDTDRPGPTWMTETAGKGGADG